MAGLVFSVISTGIFLYPLINDLLKPNPSEATVVALTLGSTGVKNSDGNMGGNIPTVAVYAEDGTEIGRSYGNSKKNWASGSTNFVTINPDKGMNGKQATYVSVATGGNDAICISAISVAWPDNSTPKAWLGDIGWGCSNASGPFWANSVTQTGSDTQYQSKCIWIDGDDTDGITTKGLSLHIVDFSHTDGATNNDGTQTTNPVAIQWNNNKDLLCKAPGRMNFYNSFQADDYPDVYQPPLQYNADGTDKDPSKVIYSACDDDPELLNSACTVSPRESNPTTKVTKRARVLKRSSPMANTLVHSNSTAHSAEELCNHPGSISPSFVSHYEGKFCDMATRIVWPLCSYKITSGCFDSYSNKLVLDEKRLNSTHMNLMNPKGNGSYEWIVHW